MIIVFVAYQKSETFDPKVRPYGGALRWGPKVGPESGALGWYPKLGPQGGTLGWDPNVKLVKHL